MNRHIVKALTSKFLIVLVVSDKTREFRAYYLDVLGVDHQREAEEAVARGTKAPYRDACHFFPTIIEKIENQYAWA